MGTARERSCGVFLFCLTNGLVVFFKEYYTAESLRQVLFMQAELHAAIRKMGNAAPKNMVYDVVCKYRTFVANRMHWDDPHGYLAEINNMSKKGFCVLIPLNNALQKNAFGDVLP